MRDPHWYEPTPRGLEGKIKDKMARLAELDAQWRAENKPKKG
jgi:putative ATPase